MRSSLYVTLMSGRVAADTTAPSLSSATATATAETTADLSVDTNEDNGTLYWVVTRSGTGPSAAQVKAGQDDEGSAAADSGSQAVNGTGTQNISGGATGLTSGLTYYAHYMHEDSSSNQSAVATSAAFTTDYAPLSIFGGGTYAGFLHDYTGDPSATYGADGLSLLYQDFQATAVSADGQTIAVSLDQSLGPDLGSELVTNGTFDSDTGWTKGTGWTITDGVLRATSVGAFGSSIEETVSLTNGELYRAEVEVTAYTIGKLRCTGASTAVPFVAANGLVSAAGSYAAFWVPSAGDGIQDDYYAAAFTDGVNTYDIDNVTLKQVQGDHGTQATSAAEPTFKTGSPNFVRGDGVDDNFLTTRVPSTTMTLIEVGTPDSGSAGDVLMGSQPASDGRAYLAIDANGYLAGGVGTQGTSTIVDSGSTDIRSTKCGKAVVWDGSTVKLYLKTAGGSFQTAYSAAQSGAVNTTIPIRTFGLNNNGTAAALADSDSLVHAAVNTDMSAADIEAFMDHYLNK